MEIGKESAARRPAGKVSSLRLTPPPPAAGDGGDRLIFTVRDLIARRFHYLCTNVTFSSDQGARQPLASSQTVVQKVLSQSELSVRTEVSGGTGRRQNEEDIKKQKGEHKAADGATLRLRAMCWINRYLIK